MGKTTTALNLGAGLARRGHRVLFVDLDPQCSLSYALGVDAGAVGASEVLTGNARIRDAIVSTPEGDLLPGDMGLSSMSLVLIEQGKEFKLREALSWVAFRYDYIVIDGPPTLGILTINILTAADKVIVPVLADIFSLQGVGQFYATFQAVKQYCNPKLVFHGLLLTRHTDRLLLNREMCAMLEDTAAHLGTQLYTTRIRESVVLREAIATRQSIFRYAPKSRQAADYEAFVQEYLGKSRARSHRK